MSALNGTDRRYGTALPVGLSRNLDRIERQLESLRVTLTRAVAATFEERDESDRASLEYRYETHVGLIHAYLTIALSEVLVQRSAFARTVTRPTRVPVFNMRKIGETGLRRLLHPLQLVQEACEAAVRSAAYGYGGFTHTELGLRRAHDAVQNAERAVRDLIRLIVQVRALRRLDGSQ